MFVLLRCRKNGQSLRLSEVLEIKGGNIRSKRAAKSEFPRSV